MSAGQETAPYPPSAFVKTRRRRKPGTSHPLRMHHSLHRVSWDRDMRHEAAGRALRMLFGVAAMAVGLVVVLVVLYVLIGGSAIPDPVPQKCCCVVAP